MKRINLLLTILITLLLGACVIIEPYDKGDYRDDAPYRQHDSISFIYKGPPIQKLFIRSGWVVDSIDVDKHHSIDGYRGPFSTAIGGRGGTLRRYMLYGLEKIVLHKGWFDNQRVIANITFYYKGGRVRSAGTMQETTNVTTKVYFTKGKYLKSYRAESYGKYLNDLKLYFAYGDGNHDRKD
jgi:hypothetical protein